MRVNQFMHCVIAKARHTLVPHWAKKKYNEYLAKKDYLAAMNMPKCEYEEYLCKRYEEMMNRYPSTRGLKMDFENPKTYTQKQQWLKLYDQSEKKSLYSDKYAVRQHVKDIIGEEYLIPLITVNGKDHFYDAFDIDFDVLPESFVLKCNHGSHYNVIIKDKNKLSKTDIHKIKKQLNTWLKEHYAFLVGLELVYESIRPCIIIEKYMAINDDLPDYKFMCFSGEVKYVWCDQGRFIDHRRSLFDTQYNLMPFNMHIHENVKDTKKPKSFDTMLEIAGKLCDDFSYVRVDLYDIEGKVYFGELTFSSGAGFQAPNPVEYDLFLGEQIVIKKEERDNNYCYRKS